MRNIITLLFLILTLNVFATNYYVSNNGSDAALGTSEGTAWETISKVNGETFSPGDSILFEKGGIWRETLTIPSSGTSGNHITFSSYGTGNKPKIWGSVGVNSYTEHPSYPNVYRCEVFVDLSLVDGIGNGYPANIFIAKNGSPTDSLQWGRQPYRTTFSGMVRNFDYYWRNDSVYFYYNGDISDIDSIEIPQLDRVINAYRNYITIDGLDLRYCGTRAIGNGTYPESTFNGLQIRNNYIGYIGYKGSGAAYGIAIWHSNMIIEENEIRSCGRRNVSIGVTNGTYEVTVEHVHVRYNYLHDGYHTTGTDWFLNGGGHYGNDWNIYGNIIYDDSVKVFDEIEKLNSNSIFIENNGAAGEIDTVRIFANVARNTSSNCFQLNGVANAYVVGNTGSGIFSQTAGTTGIIYHGNMGYVTNTTALNNILYNYDPTASGSSFQNIHGATGGNTNFETIDYNLHWVSGDADNYMIYDGVNTYTQSQFTNAQAAGYEVNSPTPSDPLFTDNIYNLRVTEGSPAIEAATPYTISVVDPLGETIVLGSFDVLGIIRDVSTPDIGAYEYSGVSSETDITSLNISGQVSSSINAVNHTGTITVEYGTDVSASIVIWTLSLDATSSPLSGTSQDYTTPLNVLVTAEDESTQQNWIITVIVQEAPTPSTTTYFKNNGKYNIDYRTGQRQIKKQ